MTDQFALVTGLHWGAIACYMLATIVVAYGTFFANEKAEGYGTWLAVPGALLHLAGLITWWRVTGHGPYLGRFEVLSKYALVLVVGYLVFLRFYPRIKAVGLAVFPVSVFMVGLSLFLKPEVKQVTPIYKGIWLVLHIAFYNIAFCSIVIATAFSVFYLMKTRNKLQRFKALPEPQVLDLYAYRFVGFGFIFWGIGMLMGSIWAYQSWNIFWNWAPVQTWSLLAWIMFGIYLHLRKFFGWQGERAAWLFVACFGAVMMALFLTPFLETSIHQGYFK